MKFLNPFDLLNIPINSLSELDPSMIKKAKRKILAEIELSDYNYISFKGIELSKFDILNSFDELGDSNKKEFYFFLYNYKELNNFLFNGETKFFVRFRQESIFTLSEFIDFISPYYAPKYSTVLLMALEKKSEKALRILNNIPLLINDKYIDQAYKDAHNYIKNKINWIDKISKEIKNETSGYDERNIANLIDNLKNEIHQQTLNLLPTYFQESINNLAFAIRNLSIKIFNNIGDSEAALEVLKISIGLNIDGLTRDKIQKDLIQINEINEERKEIAKHEPLLQKYAKIFIKLRFYIKELDENESTPDLIYDNVKNIINIDELNSLPELFDEVRNQIIYGLRNLSVSSWNNHSDADTAIKLIEMAKFINTDAETKALLKEDLDKLNKLKIQNICYYCKNAQAEKGMEVEISMYQITKRHLISKSYKKISVPIPRCRNCYQIHRKSSNIYLLLTIIIFLIISIAFFEEMGIFIVIPASIGALLGAKIIHLPVEQIYFIFLPTKPEENVSENELIISLKSQGWKIGESPGKYE